MSFFGKTHVEPEEAPKQIQQEEKIDPRLVIIDGDNLVKLVADNPAIPVGKVDRGVAAIGLWQPSNYNPETGEMI